MSSPYAVLKNSIEKGIGESLAALGYSFQNINGTIETKGVAGDISCSVALRLSGAAGKSREELADRIASGIGRIAFVEKVTTENGFINFHLDKPAFSKEAIAYIMKRREGSVRSDERKTAKMIVEYPSVNPVHPWHVGQVRSAILGDVMSNIYEACGYVVEREDYIDDLGLQMAEAVWGTINAERLGIERDAKKKFDHAVGEVYVSVNRLLEREPQLIGDIKKVLASMEQDGTYESKLSREMAEEYVRAEYLTAFDFGMYHNVLIWESDIVRNNLLGAALGILKEKGITKRPSEGKYANCVVIDIKDLKNLPKELSGLREESKVLVRSDGTPNYLAKDIAFHMWKLGIIKDCFLFRKFMESQPNGAPLYTTGPGGDRMDFGGGYGAINTIDSRQSYEQMLIRVVLDSIGEGERVAMLKHLAYGVVELESGPLAGRRGTFAGYTADDLLREAKEMAKSMIKKGDLMGAAQRESVARAVAISAIKFEFLKVSPERKIVFSWKRALNFEGDSGPYCQYTYARAARILEKSGLTHSGIDGADLSQFTDERVFSLVKLMAMAHSMVEKAAAEYRPNVITEYIIDLAVSFSRFYENIPVLKSNTEEEARSKLAVVSAFAHTMRGMLGVLGIEAIDSM
jgi:arginyl-tRNA synthetase